MGKALSSGRRAEIVDLLAQGERSVDDVAAELGQSVANTSHHLRNLARAGLVRTYQLSSEFGRLTVLENLLVAAPGQRGERIRTLLHGKRYWRNQEVELLDQARILLDRFAMRHTEDEYAGNLSGGQKRLLEIMRALMCQPKLLLLDEPMAGVNPTLAQAIEGYLADLAAEGLTMLLVEHELGLVERLSESVIVMAQGEVIATGSMPDLRRRPEVLNAYLAG